jgi:O-methyltransferase involved in polyketide biosynthesis
VDLPEVIAIRRRFFADTDRRRAIEGDLTDPALFDRLLSLTGTRPTLVLMEGVLYYLDPAQVAAVFARLGAAHDAVGVEGELGFDVVSATGLQLSNAANTDSHRTATAMAWACRGLPELLEWDPRLELVEISDHGSFIPPDVRPLFTAATARDGLAPMSVLHLKRSPALSP